SEVLIVGDTIEEVQIARHLGALVCSITHGNCSTNRLKEAKPDYLISDLGQIVNIVRKINF
ncbi:MAG: HAD hydrolase-like protein, partial [Candidatus Paceibacterota bacterium]